MARQNFVEKTFMGGSKTAKFVKVFSLKSFLLYGITEMGQYTCTMVLPEPPTLNYRIAGNFDEVLIWRFGKFGKGRQIKSSPI